MSYYSPKRPRTYSASPRSSAPLRSSVPRAMAKPVYRLPLPSAVSTVSTARRFGSPVSAMAALRGAVGEKKGMDTSLTLSIGNLVSTTNTNDAAFVLNLIRMGSGSWNRVGRRTQLKSLRITGTVQGVITPDATTGQLIENVVRMVVVWDRQPSGSAIPAFDAVFGITQQDGMESCPNIFCPPRFDNMERFRVLRDCKYQLDPDASAGLGTTRPTRVTLPIDEYVKLPLLESNYSGQSEPMSIADISTGALYVYFRATFNTASGSQAFTDATARIRYTD